MLRLRITLVAVLALSSLGCLRMGEASSDERAQLAAWSRVVTDKDRAEVQREAASHTDWMERKRVLFMISQYRARYTRAAAKQPTTKPTTAATRPGL